jgi:hypothetical protein
MTIEEIKEWCEAMVKDSTSRLHAQYSDKINGDPYLVVRYCAIRDVCEDIIDFIGQEPK